MEDRFFGGKNMENIRNDDDLPECIIKWNWKYHHTGIPTLEKRPMKHTFLI